MVLICYSYGRYCTFNIMFCIYSISADNLRHYLLLSECYMPHSNINSQSSSTVSLLLLVVILLHKCHACFNILYNTTYFAMRRWLAETFLKKMGINQYFISLNIMAFLQWYFNVYCINNVLINNECNYWTWWLLSARIINKW